jgi:hypothetical protein
VLGARSSKIDGPLKDSDRSHDYLHVPMKIARRTRSRARRWAVGLCLVVLAAGPAAIAMLFAGTSAAGAHSPPEYSLSIVEGADTQPEDSILHVSAQASPTAPVVVSLTHDGLVVVQDSGEGGAWLSQVPQVGDVVTLESPSGVPRGTVVYDGLPSIAATTCAGSTGFSGQRTAGYAVEGGYYTVIPHPSYFVRRGGGVAQVQSLAGSGFAGVFLSPLQLGQTVYAVESLSSPIAGGTFAYSSEFDRPVGACPVPPPPPPPPPPVALLGSIAKLAHLSLRGLLRSGWSTHVSINQPGRIVEDLYGRPGVLPAFAAASNEPAAGARARRHRKPAAPLLARGTLNAAAAGVYTVTLHPTALGRRLLRHAHSAKAVLIATLTSASGARLTLARQSLTLHR